MKRDLNHWLSNIIHSWKPVWLGLLLVAMYPAAHADNCTASPVNGATYQIINYSSGKAVDVAGKSEVDGANVLSWTDNGGTNQQFTLSDVGSGYWRIKAVHSDKVLTVENNSSSNGGNIVQDTDADAENQQWQLNQVSSGAYSIVARSSDKALTVAGGSNGDNIYQNTDVGVSSQRWYLNPVDVACDDADGFAAQSGSDGLSTTIGGGSVQPTTVTSCSALINALTSTSPAVVHIPDNTSIDCRTAGTTVATCAIACPEHQDPGETIHRIPGGSQTCTDLGSDTDDTVNQTRNERSIHVTSNKTLIGLGSGSKIIGANLKLSGSSNIIIRNLTIEDVNPHLVEAGDGITLDGSSHVWIDHVGFNRISDGHVDVKDSENVTLSWNHFDGYNSYVCANQHWYTHSVVDSQVTFHNNFWDYTGGRNPKLDGDATRAHIYNNYYLEVTYFAINTNNGAQALIEGNYFADTRSPHWNVSGFMDADLNNNEYTGQSATDPERDTGDTVFGDVVMYPYTLDDALNAPNLDGTTGPQ